MWLVAAVLAATWNLLALCLREEPDRTTRANQEMDSGASELRKSKLRDQGAPVERDLAAIGRDVEPQTATTTSTVDEASPAKQPANVGSAELQESLQREGDRASRLEQDLAVARRDVETQTTPATKAAAAEVKELKTADADSADLRKSLQQEQDRARRLEQDLAGARRDVATQTALAAKAVADANQLKKTADSSTADLRQSLQQERDRASGLEQDLAAARRDVETQTARAAKAGAEASRLKKTVDAGANLRKSLQQERDRASRLEQDLARARRDVATQTALVTKAGEEAAKLKEATEKSSAELRQSLQQEHDKVEALTQELSTARTKIYAYEAQARQASDHAAESGTADLRKSLQQEHDRASELEQDLAAARRDVATQTTLATKAGEEAAKLKEATEKSSAELRQSLQQEHDKVEALTQELSTARTKIYAYEAQARQASDHAAESGTADLRKPLQQEHERATGLEPDLAASRREIETQATQEPKATAEPSRLKKTANAGADELPKSVLERDPALVRNNESAPSIVGVDQISTQHETEAAKPLEAEQAAVANSRADVQTAEDAAKIARLMAQAHVLLGRGDIGSARIVLQRATEMGSAQASFTLAETYDPLILSKWGTYGTRGDANRALDLYARALADGIEEAKERSDALHR
ncbi:hypothetical protein QA641_14310 [Bradyrhizobium sp. CB1650]|uniref:hypothetical protein n=1 Tax=Bradyrhizobium sp. CB1650 TaxID=3039153 RepID=UPI0024350CE9|nr:hypothetical protein [Bradyrhizobium sp. CB1650]WGD54979.1 hypothetical protein QA641_14310 [Bradyrhizobium sp. CB1650]